jgi:hypothetical protein
MAVNNSTGLLDVGNVTGALGAGNTTGLTEAATVNIPFTLGIFVVSWIVLCAIMYFIAPYFAKFADPRSRIAYSAVYSLPFAIIFALGLGGTMSVLSQSNFIVSLLVAFVIVFGLVIFQNFLLGFCISKGIIKMESKRQPPAAVKGSRNTKGKRK